ncbi:pleckstrin homology domain-containing family G member 5 [Rhinichthys klamathensis goyatoka]|uniref:pleckstrin homology domain-containing family G member 5 n=1 Tax=Rhinichthys klamathensis goyatoka TaxID=3034132 RepID=UPI0024B573DE|nr:pleckstrin homology domain-containing family G member 5 [Rhinichthys klamathensis goyatoka]
MDTDKSSNPSKGPELSNIMAPEETALGDKREEEKEADVVPGGIIAVPPVSQRRAQEKHRYYTIGHQKKKQRSAVDFSTMSKGTSAVVKTRGALKQALFSQGVSDKNSTLEVDALKQVLDSFNMPADLRWTWGEGGTERALEKSWTDIVHSHEFMSKTQRHQQEALWEFLNTELNFINKLTIVKELVLAALSHCHGHGFLQEVRPTMLFSNLPSILDAHRLFWHEVMYPMLQEVRLTGRPFDPLKLEAGCLQFPERFPAYFEYCWEGERNVEFARRQLDTNPHFHTYLMWVENHPQCGRMRLGEMQAKAYQRITKYHLLLKAIQKNTQNHPTQIALERMLNSVNHFLESINDYMHLKEDLSVAAQRIEGHKIEGLSEEIDKHVRELCCFDLTSPMRGVGPNVIRRLLLEETLKVRVRKDNKELVVLLFTDVLLMTKTQRKSDKLKVVRPPLPLERIHCIQLKDGYSFVLVEVGDLGCSVSVNFLSTPSPDNCVSWVSALRETQAALESLRRNETNKTLKTTRQAELVGSERPPIQNKLPDKVIEDPGGQSDSDRSDSDFDQAECLNSLNSQRRTSETDVETDVEQSKVQQPAEDQNSPRVGHRNDQGKSSHEEVVGKTDSAGFKTNEGRNRQWEEEEVPFKINERRVTWKHDTSSNSNEITQQDLLVRNGHSLLPGGHVDKNATFSQSMPSTSSSIKPLVTTPTCRASVETEKPHLDPYDDSQGIRKNSLCSQPEDDNGFLTESGRFIRNVKSPRLRKKHPKNLQPSIHPDSSKEAANGLELPPNTNSNGNQRRASRVLKLGFLKNNHETLWNVPEKRSSPDPETLSEPEQKPDGNRQTKPRLKTQRSASIQEISSSRRRSPSPPPDADQLHPSPLQHLLQRAKEREKERARGKRVGKTKERTSFLKNSPTISASPSPSASEGEREAEGEKSAGPRVISTHRWIEGNVDGSEDEKDGNVMEGVSVDWPGWCFDDEEVFGFEDFDAEDWFDPNLTINELRRSETKRTERKDDTECSEV